MRPTLMASLSCLMAEPAAFRWVCLQENLMRAPNTVEAYARGINDWLCFCYQSNIPPVAAGRELLALYVNHLSTTQCLAASTLRHRLYIVRLYYDYLHEEGLITVNPVMRGSWRSGGHGLRSSDRWLCRPDYLSSAHTLSGIFA